MTSKSEYLEELQAMKARWEALLGGLSEDQLVAPELDMGWSVKDVVAHLMAWQRITNARLRAALRDEAPDFGEWPEGLQPDSEEDLEAINAWIYKTYHDLSWGSVYQYWRSGYQRLLDTAQAVPESILRESGRFAWLPDYPLSAVLDGTLEHHEEHYGWLVEWLEARG